MSFPEGDAGILFGRALGRLDLDRLAALIASGADVNRRMAFGNTSLHCVLTKGLTQLTARLQNMECIESSCDVIEESLMGSGFDNIEERRVAAVRMLINAGADVNAQNQHFRTPLFIAAARGQVEIVRMLVENGAIINSAAQPGDTPLRAAFTSNRRETCAMLVELGANPDEISDCAGDFKPFLTAIAEHRRLRDGFSRPCRRRDGFDGLSGGL